MIVGMKFIKANTDFKIFPQFNIAVDDNMRAPIEAQMHVPAVNPQKVTKPAPKVMTIDIASAVMRPAKDETKRSSKSTKIYKDKQSIKEEENHCKNEFDSNNSTFEWAGTYGKQSNAAQNNLNEICFILEKTDLITSALIIMVFRSTFLAGPRTKMMFDISSVLRSYINVLRRLKCNIAASEIIKYCQVNEVHNEYNKNTVVSSKCQYCNNKESGNQVKCYLDKCGKFNNH